MNNTARECVAGYRYQALPKSEVMLVNSQASDFCFWSRSGDSKLGRGAGWPGDPAVPRQNHIRPYGHGTGRGGLGRSPGEINGIQISDAS